MSLGKYKYYFKKPRSAIVKDVFRCLLIGGAIAVAATSPYFVQNLFSSHKKWRKYSKQQLSSTFDRLRRQGVISIVRKNNQIFISLTSDGRKKAGVYQIDSLKISKPKHWDKKWRLLIFDIPQKKKLIREALRGKLIQLGLEPLQKSAWLYPYNYEAEFELLRDFFDLNKKEMRLIITKSVELDKEWKKVFELP